MTISSFLIVASALVTLVVTPLWAAVVVPIEMAYGHNNRDNYGGNIVDVHNGSGMNGYNWTTGNPNDFNAAPANWPSGQGFPSTWTQTSGQYRDEWQADQLLDRNTSINAKIGWIILDLGASNPGLISGLENLYLWNGVQIGTNAMKDFNIYVSTAPVVPSTQGPTSGSVADDYDFGVAAWTRIGGIQTLVDGGSNSGVYGLGGVHARYIGIEMLSRYSGNFDPNVGRIGFGEAAVTAIPEPSIFGAIGLMSGMMMFARRSVRSNSI